MTADSVRLRRLLPGAALRHYRESAGATIRDVADLIECYPSKISRIETGQRGIRVTELRELLREYGVPQPEQDILLAITRAGQHRGWWRKYADLLPANMQDYIFLESLASEALVYEPQRIPELLQTADYASEVLRADPAGLADEATDRLTEVIRTRQEAFRERGLRLEVVIGEAALHQAVGGAGVMRAQLRALAALAGTPDPVTIHVVPFSAGAHTGTGSGPLSILRYRDAPGIGVVYQPGITGGTAITGASDRAAFLRAFGMIRAAALTTATSRQLIGRLADG